MKILFNTKERQIHLLKRPGVEIIYSWMKYYNSELGSIKRNHFDRNVLKELLDDVKKSIENS